MEFKFASTKYEMKIPFYSEFISIIWNTTLKSFHVWYRKTTLTF